MLTDESIMPCGKHEGKKLANVPDEHLLFLYRETDIKNQDLIEYIEENLDVLTKDENLNDNNLLNFY